MKHEYIYKYQGRPKLKVTRLDPSLETGSKKKIYQSRSDDGGATWLNGALKDGEIVDLLDYEDWRDLESEVYVCEGEKKARGLRTLGLTATSASGGSSKEWLSHYSENLRDRNVILLADNDDPGRKFVHRAHESIRKTAKSSKIIMLPDLNDGEDVADWIAKGRSGADLRDYCANHDDTLAVQELFKSSGGVESEKLKSEKSTGFLDVQPLEQFEKKHQPWLWKYRIPIGHVTLIEGYGGLGKSFVAISLLSDITKGRPLFGDDVGTDPRNVMFFSSEDSVEHVLKPRFESNDADQKRVLCLRSDLLLDDENLEALKKTISMHEAAAVVLDPVSGFIQLDGDKAKEVRPFIGKLMTIAEENKCAIILIRHWNKNVDASSAHRGLGSTEWRNAVKSQFVVVADSDGELYLAHEKFNYSPAGRTPTLRFEINDAKVCWIGESDLTADELIQPSQKTGGKEKRESKAKLARAFLIKTLSEGPKLQAWLTNEAERLQISYSSLYRAAISLGVPMKQTENVSYWYPSQDPAFQVFTFQDSTPALSVKSGVGQ